MLSPDDLKFWLDPRICETGVLRRTLEQAAQRRHPTNYLGTCAVLEQLGTTLAVSPPVM